MDIGSYDGIMYLNNMAMFPIFTACDTFLCSYLSAYVYLADHQDFFNTMKCWTPFFRITEVINERDVTNYLKNQIN